VVVGQLVVRRVTAPLGSLVQFARELSPEDVGRRAPVSQDEMGVLAEAFNGVLDRHERSQQALVRSEKLALAGLFAARVAHDIRNPLASIKMQTQLLRARASDDDERAALTAVLQDVNQVELVIQDLVDVARPESLTREPASINAVIREALRHLEAQFTHRKIAVRLALADPIPALRLDRVRFRQALLNLLVNASEAMPTGGTVDVRSRADDGVVSVEICDDGTGLPADGLDRLFDPFFSTKREGVGLGLVNVQAVVHGHGGEIRLTPRTPKGTCALITLPVEGNPRS
jgi:two-component system sensor histidine kinase HydH